MIDALLTPVLSNDIQLAAEPLSDNALSALLSPRFTGGNKSAKSLSESSSGKKLDTRIYRPLPVIPALSPEMKLPSQFKSRSNLYKTNEK